MKEVLRQLILDLFNTMDVWPARRGDDQAIEYLTMNEVDAVIRVFLDEYFARGD